jgi:DNA-binding protein YbaB
VTEDRERIDVLREDLDVESQRYEQAAQRLVATEASDEHRTVEIRLDPDGALEWVRVHESWRRHHDAASLGGAVLEAYTSAAGERARLWSEASIDEDRPPTRARPAARTLAVSDEVTEALRVRGSSVDPSVLAALGEMLDDLDRGFDQAMADVEDRLIAPTAGHSTSGHVTARVVGDGQLVAVEMDERWLDSAHSFNIGRETTEAVADARRRIAERSAAAMRDSGLGRLQALTADPQALLRHLGLDPT